MFVPLAIPPGVYRNGTDLQAQGRWHDISLVRWKDGAMQPIGGWRERMDFTSGKYRGALAWQDNSGDRWLAVGSYNKLKVSTRAGVVTDITPAGLTAGDVNAMENVGYGGGPYGVDAYGVTRSSGGTYQEATTWAMDAWGEYLLACSSADGKIYEWQLDTGTPAAAVSGAPTGCLGVLVTHQRLDHHHLHGRHRRVGRVFKRYLMRIKGLCPVGWVKRLVVAPVQPKWQRGSLNQRKHPRTE